MTKFVVTSTGDLAEKQSHFDDLEAAIWFAVRDLNSKVYRSDHYFIRRDRRLVGYVLAEWDYRRNANIGPPRLTADGRVVPGRAPKYRDTEYHGVDGTRLRFKQTNEGLREVSATGPAVPIATPPDPVW